MLSRFAVAIGKDLRLLIRDRVGLLFLTLAPIIVITVAGFSLATLYGANAYVLPFADEDGGEIGRKLRDRLASEAGVELRQVATREAARELVRTREAGAALSIPSGTSLTIQGGGTSRILLYTDPVKSIEVANLRALVQELRHGIEQGAHERARARLRKAQKRALSARARFESVAAELRERLATLPSELTTARAETEKSLANARARMERELRAAASAAAASAATEARTRLRTELAPLRDFLKETAARRQEFIAWLDVARDKGLRFSSQIPPLPTPPPLPPQLAALAGGDVEAWLGRVLPTAASSIRLPTLSTVDLPEPPALPEVALPRVPKSPRFKLPGALEIKETSVTGAPLRLNTFDQNVPGFSVTFLLLGMLLGISLGLLDERDWGTLERLRATPTPFSIALVAKLLARFLVGVVQMIILFAVGWAVFGISLGPQPWALLLPTTGIVFAGTAFGLIVAGLARSREAVLPLGSMVIITMAAVGGCWWPIELEPAWMRRLALAFPTTWAMAAYNDLMIRQQPVEVALRPTAVLYAFGSIYLALGLALFRRRSFS